MGNFKAFNKVDYSHITDWKFLPDPRYRDECDHVWVMEFTGIDSQFKHVERKCERWAKYQHGDILLCGLHTPGYGRKGPRSVPRDLPASRVSAARERIEEVASLLRARNR
jgi:hypothetical protein